MARSGLAVAFGVSALVVTARAQATYSIVAMERTTGRTGAASASCVGLSTLQRVYATVPGKGAVLTQAQLVAGDASQALALQLLGQGARAGAVIEAMTDPQFDAGFTTRQYVVLDAVGGLAAFTGRDTNPFAAHLDASDTRFSVGIAGNYLTGAEVLDGAARGFGEAAACDLEERLVNALVAASTDELGDARCVVDGRPAQSSWLHVAGANGAADLDIAVAADSGIDPIPEVLSRFSEWRSSHPCAEVPELPDTPSRSAPSGASGCGCALAASGNGGSPAIWAWCWWLAVLSRRQWFDRPKPCRISPKTCNQSENLK